MKELFKKIIIKLLTAEARLALHKYKPRIIAVTGTVGKTTTKDAVYTALTPFVSVRKNEKSFNSTFGVPLTILGCESAYGNPLLWIRNVIQGLFVLFPLSYPLNAKRYPEWLVLEVGVGEPGDIRQFESWLHPDVVVMTRFARVPVHVEFFASPEAVFEEKKILLRMLKRGGTLVLNADDDAVRGLANGISSPPVPGGRVGEEVVTFGIAAAADVRGTSYQAVSDSSGFPTGIQFVIQTQGKNLPMGVRGAIGEYLMQPMLAAVAVVRALGFDVSRAVEALRRFTSPSGRMRLLPGKNSTLLIDDSYNASPLAVEQALRTLSLLKISGRKIAVLGDMAELGTHAAEEHERAGMLAAHSADMLLAVGEFALQYVLGAEKAGMPKDRILLYSESNAAGEELRTMLSSGDVVLIKGSAKMKMERAVEALMVEPARAPELLVRQENSWKRR